jgi:hypothetical protein
MCVNAQTGRPEAVSVLRLLEAAMRFEDKDDGDYRIHAGSMELRDGHGFMAAVIVRQFRKGNPSMREVYRDIAISGGHCWLTSEMALRQAFLQGSGVVKAERDRTAVAAAPRMEGA